MSFWTLVIRSLRYHARSHLGVLLGAIVGSTALVGALVVGDSVRGSLREMALLRLGNVDAALAGGDRFFRDQLADEITNCAPVLQLAGTAATSDGAARANRVQILGIDERLKRIQSPVPGVDASNLDEAVINSALARQLNARVGDSVLLRVQKPSALSREAPISPQQDFSVALRLTVQSVANEEQLGRFDLKASQLPPLNAFVPLRMLQQKLELTNRANLLLVRGATAESANDSFRKDWHLADAELERRGLTSGLEVRSRRVFIDPPIVEAARRLDPKSRGILTYFVNELRVGDKATPYSMVTGASASLVSEEMHDDEIAINDWLAEDLQAKIGDTLQLRYFVIGSTQRLEERTNSFRIRTVVPMEPPYADRELMPDFPGLAKAESTENWDAGFPIQMSKIRSKDEKYWKDFRGTPKAFVTLAAAQSMWSNRFGNLTAVRFSAATDSNKLASALMQAVDPASLGLMFQPVRAQALAASAGSQDFGQLFLGFSFFLIVAALILMGLLFQFALEQRTPEAGTLLALGFRPKQVRRLFLGEATVLALLGGIIGVGGGILYAKAMLVGLTTIWSKAVANSALRYHAQPATLLIGAAASFVVALITIMLVLRKQARRPARELLVERAGVEAPLATIRKSRGMWIGSVCIVFAAAVILMSLARGATSNPAVFFTAGVLLLIGGLASAGAFLSRLLLRHSSAVSGPASFDLTLTGLGVRAATRRRKRSLATMGLLACGSFIVVAVGANRLDANRDAWQRSSGTGGFALIGESSLPVFHDLNAADGRDFYGLNADELREVSFVPMRVREGDDASCLNLNRAQTPRLLGVWPGLLDGRKAFSFQKIAPGYYLVDHPWFLLDHAEADGSVPAIADYNSILWAMGKKLGDTLDYIDERGRPFKVKLVGGVANSILQGNVLISERNFVQRFPGAGGYRMFLVDAPSNTVAKTAAALTRGLQDAGLELTPAAERLNAFNAVQNTYLNTFQVLGGLGLLVGSAGLGVVVLRNVLERRGELALLRAVGFRTRSLRWLLLTEHTGLLLGGLAIGLISALIAIMPTLLSAASPLPLVSLAATLAALLATGLIWTWIAVAAATRGELLNALRNE